jgi:hypothetical protein
LNNEEVLRELFSDFIALVWHNSRRKRNREEILRFLENIGDIDIAITITEGLLKRFKRGRIKKWALEQMEVLQHMREIYNRQKLIEKKD